MTHNRYYPIRWVLLILFFLLQGCITPDNEVIEGLGTPDATTCSTIDGVEDGALYESRSAVELGVDGRTHPDIFYLAWAQLDQRSDLRFPESGYDGSGFEDKLLVSRKMADGTKRTWQLLPQLDNSCKDVEKVRIHSFDVAPNGRSLFISMARTPLSGTEGRDSHLGIYRFDFENYSLTKLSKADDVHFMYPTYIGNDPQTRNETLLIAKTVTKNDIPINYEQQAKQLLDEYDRAPTPLIHLMDTETGSVTRIGFNNSHQTEPFTMKDHNGNDIVVFTQWEHQDFINRFSLWKMQIDGSDNFTFYGDEAETNDSVGHLFQGRHLKTGTYQDYIIMTESHNKFDAEGHIVMTKRAHQDLRSDKIYLQKVQNVGGHATRIARNPEYYNNESFLYSYRESTDNPYNLYIKDFPSDITQTFDNNNAEHIATGEQVSPTSNNYHFVQARSFYPPEREQVVPQEGELGQNRVSFTNNNLNGKSGFLVENLIESDNGDQHQLDGMQASDLSMQFFIPSHHFGGADTIAIKSSPEMSIPASGFIQPETDGSFGIVLKNGLYVWKVNKKFNYNNSDIWLPIRSELQEVSFVPNRVNACNQCHQERDQANIDKYENYHTTIARTKMTGDLSDVASTEYDISTYNAYYSVPDFHQDIMPLFTKAGKPLSGATSDTPPRESCADCHYAGTKLNLANTTGHWEMNKTYRTVLRGAYKLSADSEKRVNYSNDSITPLNNSSAPLLWSLMLDDDLTVSGATASERALNQAGDYGARYDSDIETAIQTINDESNGGYDHSQHWSAEDMQSFITYMATQAPVGMRGRINFNYPTTGVSKTSDAGQKAYQAMVRQCFSCHNNHTGTGDNGIQTEGFGRPLAKRFSSNGYLRDRSIRFIIHSHLGDDTDTKYSSSTWRSNLNRSLSNTLDSALYHIDFRDTATTTNPASELLVYAACKDPKGVALSEGAPHFVRHTDCLLESDPDYQALKTWATGGTATNQAPNAATVSMNGSTVTEITLQEYAKPNDFDTLTQTLDGNTTALEQTAIKLQWSDPDGDYPNGDLSKLYISGGNSNNTMIGFRYEDFLSAWVTTYAILGDRGTRTVNFNVTDGQKTTSTPVKVTVESDYNVPEPQATLPNAYGFYTVHDESDPDFGKLFRIQVDANDPTKEQVVEVGTLANYDSGWTTVYRRADKGWLYFYKQQTNAGIIHVVDETNAQTLFKIQLDHDKEKRGDKHKQTLFLLWWRPGETDAQGNVIPAALEGLLESKLSDETEKNGDFYVSFTAGNNNDTSINHPAIVGDAPVDATSGAEILDGSKTLVYQPTYQTKMSNGNILSVYVWRQATFMTQLVQEGVDKLNALNLVTGKEKTLSDFTFDAKDTNSDSTIDFEAADYFNVRAVVVGEDGAFYGFNKDLSQPDQAEIPVKIFNFDPLSKTQKEITNIPPWIETYLGTLSQLKYGTPFLVIEPRQ